MLLSFASQGGNMTLGGIRERRLAGITTSDSLRHPYPSQQPCAKRVEYAGRIRNFVGEAVLQLHRSHQFLASVNRSPNRMANWFIAAFQSNALRTVLSTGVQD